MLSGKEDFKSWLRLDSKRIYFLLNKQTHSIFIWRTDKYRNVQHNSDTITWVSRPSVPGYSQGRATDPRVHPSPQYNTSLYHPRSEGTGYWLLQHGYSISSATFSQTSMRHTIKCKASMSSGKSIRLSPLYKFVNGKYKILHVNLSFVLNGYITLFLVGFFPFLVLILIRRWMYSTIAKTCIKRVPQPMSENLVKIHYYTLQLQVLSWYHEMPSSYTVLVTVGSPK